MKPLDHELPPILAQLRYPYAKGHHEVHDRGSVFESALAEVSRPSPLDATAGIDAG